jgi:acetyl esterase/lipase
MPGQKNTSYIDASPLAPEGMKTIFADRTNADETFYINDEIYCERDGRKMTLQLILPWPSPEILSMINVRNGKAAMPIPQPTPNPMRPCIVYIQGSAFAKQDVYKFVPMLGWYARRGYVVASVEYREIPNDLWPAQIQDVKTAIRYLKSKANLYGIDKNRVAVMGCSSGGMMAQMAAATLWTDKFDDGLYPEENCIVKACVSLYGPCDFAAINEAPRNKMFKDVASAVSPEGIILGGVDLDEHPEAADTLSPIKYISAEHDYPPFLLMHGDEDGMIPFEQSVRMYEKLRSCGKSVELYKVCGAGHGIYFYTDELKEIILKFLRAYV